MDKQSNTNRTSSGGRPDVHMEDEVTQILSMYTPEQIKEIYRQSQPDAKAAADYLERLSKRQGSSQPIFYGT